MILLWGVDDDSPMHAVRAELRDMHAPTFFADQRRVLTSALEGTTLRVDDRMLDLRDVSAVYVRPYDASQLPLVRRRGAAAQDHARRLDQALWDWIETCEAVVVSRPSAMAHNSSKPYQMRFAAAVGFGVPETLLTTDPQAARAFAAEHGEVIYKSISSVRSIVARLGPQDDERLERLSTCPTQFQERIDGTDHRVHVVGDRVYCCRIDSPADDYRYAAKDGAAVRLTSAALPPDCADRCRELCRLQGLVVAGIDLRLTPSGEWYCFETNPSPAFTYFDGEGEITTALARLLTGAVHARATVGETH